ncbi:dnaJ-like subfamily C member 4 [Silurus meridionalis]|nr:dnaJ-like subfamily C member 4 [Silurus meridionalis]
MVMVCGTQGMREESVLMGHWSIAGSSASYYDVLGVKPDASLEEIKNAFFDKSKKVSFQNISISISHLADTLIQNKLQNRQTADRTLNAEYLHPDSDPSNPSLHSQFVKLNEAYRVLSKEGTKKEYDFRMRHQTVDYSYRYTHNPSSAETAEDVRYWEQFRTAQDYSEEGWQKKRKKNLRLVGYCMIAMLLSIGTHYFGFRKLEEIHNDFMDKKDSVITKIYNESKERARVNGFKKQQEILRQKHAEFLERYKLRQSGKEK